MLRQGAIENCVFRGCHVRLERGGISVLLVDEENCGICLVRGRGEESIALFRTNLRGVTGEKCRDLRFMTGEASDLGNKGDNAFS